MSVENKINDSISYVETKPNEWISKSKINEQNITLGQFRAIELELLRIGKKLLFYGNSFMVVDVNLSFGTKIDEAIEYCTRNVGYYVSEHAIGENRMDYPDVEVVKFVLNDLGYETPTHYNSHGVRCFWINK